MDDTKEIPSAILDHPQKKKRRSVNSCGELAGRRKQRDSAAPKVSQGSGSLHSLSGTSIASTNKLTSQKRKTDDSDSTDDSGECRHKLDSKLRKKGSKASTACNERYMTGFQFKKKYIKW